MKKVKITGYDYEYSISEDGVVVNESRKYTLKQGRMATGYPAVTLVLDKKGKLITIHRLLATYFIENKDEINLTQVNHINGDRSDNRITNLEWVAPRENISHGKLRLKNKSSKYIGVSYRKAKRPTSKEWESRIRVKGKLIQLGCYHTELEAHKAYQAYLGEKGLINRYY